MFLRYLILSLIALAGVVVGLLIVWLIVLLFSKRDKEFAPEGAYYDDDYDDYEDEKKEKKSKKASKKQEKNVALLDASAMQNADSNKELLIRIITEDEDGKPVKESVIKADTDQIFANNTDNAVIEVHQDGTALNNNGLKNKNAKHTGVATNYVGGRMDAIDIPINIIVNMSGVGEQVYANAQSGTPINVPIAPPNHVPMAAVPAAAPAPTSMVMSAMTGGLFTLSRYDVFDHIDDMQEYATRFSVEPSVKEKSEDTLPDYLMCGDRTFALMYDKNDIVLSFILRLSQESAKRNLSYHPISVAPYPSGDDWYAVIVGRTFANKKEVYRLLEESYDYTASLFYSKEIESEADLAARLQQALEEQAQIEREAGEKEKELEQKLLDAEREYKRSLEEYKTTVYTGFKISRKEIGEDMRALNVANLEVIERYKSPQLPASLKYNEETYAMLYASDEGVIMVTQLSDEYAEELGKRHPEIRHAKFPKGPNWYVVPVDGAFEDKESVYRVLEYARAFVEEKRLMPKKPRAARKPTGNKPGRPKKVLETTDPSEEEIVLEKVAKSTKETKAEKKAEAKTKKATETEAFSQVAATNTEILEDDYIETSYAHQEVVVKDTEQAAILQQQYQQQTTATYEASPAAYTALASQTQPASYPNYSAKELKMMMKEAKRKERESKGWD